MHELSWLNKSLLILSCVSVWWKRSLSTWPTSWRTAETKSRRTYWLMEVITISHHCHQQQAFKQDCNKTHDRSPCNRSIIMDIINPDNFICFGLFYSWPGHLHHQISVGHGKISNQTVTEKHLWDYLQGIQLFCSLLLIRFYYCSAFVCISLILPLARKLSEQTPLLTVFPVWILASDSDWQWPEGQSFSLQQPEGKPAEPGEEECVSSSNNNMNILCVNYGLLQCLYWTHMISLYLILFYCPAVSL